MTTPQYNPRGMGAVPFEDGTRFRVWAPHATAVSVVGEFDNWNAEAHPMKKEDGGMWFAEVPGAKSGQQYQFELVNGERRFRKNDAYVREIHAQSALGVIYADNFKWNSPETVLANWNELVLYELHVGNFTAGPHNSPGRFEQVAARLPYLKNLGINALEIMPPMAFPSERSWGYNLTNPFAVDGSYGGPDGLKRLDRRGPPPTASRIIVDVVYQSFRPGQSRPLAVRRLVARMSAAASTSTTTTARGRRGARTRPDFGRGEVRAIFSATARCFWLDEFHMDGLRDGRDALRPQRQGREQPVPRPTSPRAGRCSSGSMTRRSASFPRTHHRLPRTSSSNEWITKPNERRAARAIDTQWDTGVRASRSAIFIVTTSGRCRPLDGRRRAGARVPLQRRRFIQRVIYSESHDQVANGKARLPQSRWTPATPTGYYARKRSTLAAGASSSPRREFRCSSRGRNSWRTAGSATTRRSTGAKLAGLQAASTASITDLIHSPAQSLWQHEGPDRAVHVHVHHLNDNDKVDRLPSLGRRAARRTM